MASKVIKGLTVEIGGDTTQLGKALDNVEKKSRDLSGELGEINRLLKLDPSNTELLAQKQKVLADAIGNTEDKLDTLREAEKQVQAQFERGEVSEEQYRALQREIIATERKLGSYEKAVKETQDAIGDLGKKTKHTAEETADLKEQVSDIATTAFTGVVGAVTGVVAALTAAAEATRDYRTEMGKLDTAFTTNGHTSEAATETYQELQGILGETDQAVEAANHLAKLTDNEKDLQTWTDICTGVYATFGASLPIEGLTEAANETAKVGQVTGPLADALNWAGVSEDAFNESLAKCTTEQERQALITQTLNGLYAESANKYRETNSEVIAANKANEAWTAGMAEVGAVIEPVITEVKTLGAEMLTKIVPVVEALLDNLPAIGVALAGITAATVAFKVASLAATAAANGMTLAQMALNLAMSLNPIGLIILAITALVAAFMVLWNKSEAFRNFWINLWNGIKAAASAVAEWLKTAAKAIGDAFINAWNGIKNAWAGVSAFFGNIWNTIKSVFNFSEIRNIGKNLIAGLWNGINDKLTWLKKKIKSFTSAVLDSIKDFFGVNSPSKETAWIGDMLDQGLAKGVTDNAKAPIRAMQQVSSGVLDAAAGNVGGIGFERQLATRRSPVGAAIGMASDNSTLAAKLDGIYERLGHLQIVLDTGTLVGETLDLIDAGLATNQLLRARGV